MARRTKFQRQQDLVLITDLYVRNQTVRAIAEHINSIRNYSVSFKTIANDIKSVIINWTIQREEILSEHVSIEFQKSYERERILWEAWERSTKRKNKKRRILNGVVGVEFGVEFGVGDWRFMELMRREAEFRCRLLGSFAPLDANNNINTNGAVLILPANGRDDLKPGLKEM